MQEPTHIKDDAHKLIESMPDDATWEDLTRLMLETAIDRRGDCGYRSRARLDQLRDSREVGNDSMKVIWSDRALRSLAGIHARISADSEANAHRVIDHIDGRQPAVAGI
jgi:hypothetical protein